MNVIPMNNYLASKTLMIQIFTVEIFLNWNTLSPLSRPIMSPHQSCMRSSVPKYILSIPRKRRKRFKIPNVSKRNYQYHSIHQYHHHDATPALDSRLYDRGRSYNKGQRYDRGWNCILLRLVLYSPKTCSAIHPINPFNILAHML